MKLGDMIKICLQNLLRRKSRTILTVLGVVVGCCAIVTMLSIGIGVQNSQEIMLSGMGDLTLIQVYGNGIKAELNDEALRKFENIPYADVAIGKTRLENVGFNIYAGENRRYELSWAEVIGMNADAMEKFGLELVEGSFPKNDFEVLAGQKTVYNFMDTERPDGQNRIDLWDYMYTQTPEGYYENNPDAELPDPFFNILNHKLEMELYSYEDYDNKFTQEIKICGVLKEDQNKDYATSEGLIFVTKDLKAIQKMVYPTSNQQKTTYDEIYVKATDISKVADVEEEIKALGYSTWSMESIRKPLEEQARQQQMMFGGLGAVSLFVAALGITNTMIMSVSERTREIGVMKALGCYLGNIRATFLMEAGFVGLIGGIIGSIISYIISIVINVVSTQTDLSAAQSFQEWFGMIIGVMDPASSPVSIVPLWLAGFAILFSIIIGLGSGFYPANKAVHISALEAIKRE